MAGDRVCLTVSRLEKSPLDNVLWMMSFAFTAQTSFTGSPILLAMAPPEYIATDKSFIYNQRKGQQLQTIYILMTLVGDDGTGFNLNLHS